jgi:hypothetical protein
MAVKPVSITEPPNESALSHDHRNEYQVKIVHEDGTEELSGWMNSEEQVTEVMSAVHKHQGSKGYWVRVRNVLGPNCPDREQRIVECPLADIPSSRCIPHDSRYLEAVGSRDRWTLGFTTSRRTP